LFIERVLVFFDKRWFRSFVFDSSVLVVSSEGGLW